MLAAAAVAMTSLVSCTPADQTAEADLLQYVDPFIGSGFHGHVFVGASVPFGMVQLGPNNIDKGWDWCSGYHYSDSICIGFSHTHLNGTGCGDMGDVMVMPMTEVNVKRGNQDDISMGYASYYRHETEEAHPDYYSVMLDRYDIKAELTATARVGLHRYTFPQGKQAHILVNLKDGVGSIVTNSYIRQIDQYTIEGYRYTRGWSPMRKVYFVLQADKPIADLSLYDDTVQVAAKSQLKARAVKGVLSFGEQQQVMVKVALSPVSCENAMANLKAEMSGFDFEHVRKACAAQWNERLNRITIETDDEAAKRVFYTSNYHTMVAPTLFCDVNGQYRGINDMIYTAPEGFTNYTTLSLWDTYRTLNPLFTLVNDEMVPDIVNTMISIYHQNDKLPVWALQSGETNCMPGYSAVPIIADAYLKGFEGFDAEEAFAAMKATTVYPQQNAVPYVVERGYIPCDKVHEATSIAMEYAVDDWGVAAMAKKMGKQEDAELYARRAMYYKQYFDSEIKFIRPKMDDGTWRTPYDPANSIHMVGDFTEGNGWQYTFFAPHDVYGLIELFGGDEEFITKLDAFFVNNDSMGETASADITGLIGQYAHGNEPSHHIAYMYAYAGQQWKVAEKVRFIMDEFYTDKPDGVIGNEDCGQMSAWYVMSSMGFYQENPSDGVFVFGSPRFDKMTVKVRGNNTLIIEAENNSKENIYIQEVYFNGKPYEKSYITYDELIAGGTLKFVMGPKPNKNFGAAKENRPQAVNEIM
ncbi:MAG: GH92 family glycosyl hydrolase [bacterium]|nr:GH92 family glycosyl hydrolase [bacterium]